MIYPRFRVLPSLLLTALMTGTASAATYTLDLNSSASFSGVTSNTPNTAFSNATGITTQSMQNSVNGSGGFFFQGSSSAQALGSAGATGLRSKTAVFFNDSGTAGTTASANAQAISSFSTHDVLLEPLNGSTVNTVTGSLNLHVSGSIINLATVTGVSADTSILINGSLDGNAFSGGITISCSDPLHCATTNSGFLSTLGLPATSSSPMGAVVNGVFNIGTFVLPVGTPLAFNLGFTSTVQFTASNTVAAGFGGGSPFSGEALADFGNTVALPSVGPVFNLPANVTASIPSLGVQNNSVVPLPGSWVLLLGGLLLLGYFGKRRVCS